MVLFLIINNYSTWLMAKKDRNRRFNIMCKKINLGILSAVVLTTIFMGSSSFAMDGGTFNDLFGMNLLEAQNREVRGQEEGNAPDLPMGFKLDSPGTLCTRFNRKKFELAIGKGLESVKKLVDSNKDMKVDHKIVGLADGKPEIKSFLSQIMSSARSLQVNFLIRGQDKKLTDAVVKVRL